MSRMRFAPWLVHLCLLNQEPLAIMHCYSRPHSGELSHLLRPVSEADSDLQNLMDFRRVHQKGSQQRDRSEPAEEEVLPIYIPLVGVAVGFIAR